MCGLLVSALLKQLDQVLLSTPNTKIHSFVRNAMLFMIPRMNTEERKVTREREARYLEFNFVQVRWQSRTHSLRVRLGDLKGRHVVVGSLHGHQLEQ